MVDKKRRVSVLSQRIAAGKADSISAEEREIVANLRNFYELKYGSSDVDVNKERSARRAANA
ncbi:hypothetical protein [Microbacterium paludicola]|uniref:hypothetical protein n=1 Tax=Microbacterium paludicola TaxID=300019 RepID=UPI0009035C74|nr:hypothetical protein [Microbacterium paludicola]APF34911.1 hypothetical protein BO218_12540 [Microbacterium paludicola]